MADVICMCIQEKRMFGRLTTFNELVCRQESHRRDIFTQPSSPQNHHSRITRSPFLPPRHPSIFNIKGRQNGFCFPRRSHQGRTQPTHPSPNSSKLQPQRWRGCWVINIFDASDIFSDVPLWSMSSFPSYFSISSVCHPWDRGCVIAPEADAGWRVKFSWGGDRWGAKAPTLNIPLRIDVSTQLHYTDCTDEAFSLWMRYLPAQDALGGKLRHMTEHIK